MPQFGDTEHDITNLFPVGKVFNYDGHRYSVIMSGKPKPPRGECKTDTYILAKDEAGNKREFKISIKQDNAEFLENKMSLERAKEIFGDDAQAIIKKSVEGVKKNFEDEYLICINSHGHTEAKSIKLGWKFELLRNDGGKKSGLIALSREQKLNIYAGTGLSDDKKNSKVNGVEIHNSGVANMYLQIAPGETNLNVILKNLIPIDDFIDSHDSDMCFACKALNYRATPDKWDGDRPLSVYVDWSICDGKLKGRLVYDKPLETKGNAVGENIQSLLKRLRIDASNFASIKGKVAPGTKIYE